MTTPGGWRVYQVRTAGLCRHEQHRIKLFIIEDACHSLLSLCVIYGYAPVLQSQGKLILSAERDTFIF